MQEPWRCRSRSVSGRGGTEVSRAANSNLSASVITFAFCAGLGGPWCAHASQRMGGVVADAVHLLPTALG